MIRVKVQGVLSIGRALGSPELEVELPDSSILQRLLEKMVREAGHEFAQMVLDDRGRPADHIRFLINGRDAYFAGGHQARLEDGDTVTIIPPLAGG